MPVLKCPNGKYRIGSGPCIYASKEKAEQVQKAIHAQQAQKLSATEDLAAGKLAKYVPPAISPGSASGAKAVLKKVYTSCRTKQFPGETHEAKMRCSKIAWSAVKDAGYKKNKDSNWVK